MAPLDAPQDRGQDHPFDTPFSMMQTMQAELIKLREDLRLEMHERKTEVAGLKNEIQELREVIRRDELKQQADADRLANSIKDLQKKEDTDWRTTRRDMEGEFAKRTTCVEHSALSSRADDNATEIHKCREDFSRILRELQERIDANSKGDNEFAQVMQKELVEQRRRLDKNAENDQVFEETVVAQLRMAGHLLQAAGVSDRIQPDFTALMGGAKPPALGTSGGTGF